VERERGEGSEDGSSTPSRYRKTPSERDADSVRSTRRMKPMPLDQLLDFNDLAEETEIITSSAPTSPTTVSLEQHNESLSMAEKRCRHLSTLLMESEANEARLSQLVDALKEEIRRNERSEERQKHIENLEYMKNVVLKVVLFLKITFQTLQITNLYFCFLSFSRFRVGKNGADWFPCSQLYYASAQQRSKKFIKLSVGTKELQCYRPPGVAYSIISHRPLEKWRINIEKKKKKELQSVMIVITLRRVRIVVKISGRRTAISPCPRRM